MIHRIDRNWPTLLGAIFIFIALITLLKYSVDLDYISDSIKIGTGILLGCGLVVVGLRGALRSSTVVSEVFTGLGVALLYMTCAFAGVYYNMWDSMVVLLSMLAITVGTCIYAVRFNSRLLMSIGLIGAILSPIVMQPETDQVFSLFLYLLVINTAFWYISVMKKWFELRLISFIGTWLLYTVYFILFHPHVDLFWSRPFLYALAAYSFYILAMFLASYKQEMKFDGLHVYLGIANAVIFGLWSLGLLTPFVSFAVPLFFMGMLYIIAAVIVQRLVKKWSLPVMTKLFGGLLLVIIATTQFGKGWDYKPLISVYLWVFIAAAVLITAKWCAVEGLKYISVIIWASIGLYWYVVTWSTPRGEWFGMFIPFLNWGAVAWIVLAALGFYMSLHLDVKGMGPYGRMMISTVLSLASHLIVGGLLTVQVQSLFSVYDIRGVGLTLSISWALYSLLLFLWGMFSNQWFYRIFGTAVLLLVAAKTMIIDLAEQATIYKVVVFLVLGGICFFISYINSRWNPPPKKTDPVQQKPQPEQIEWDDL
ncbi:DUF2339 domain-containing protein [Paenibacillus guangzhouensis]|uniref:DUF2339 domain-containing protein n=1 Tax=Paenibacillus guangzhouensis TaxID=1473112 RepID=UPI001266FAC6|nr:DUF2339 domain-containing protein [Paenibacillus guangzhouensis]